MMLEVEEERGWDKASNPPIPTQISLSFNLFWFLFSLSLPFSYLCFIFHSFLYMMYIFNSQKQILPNFLFLSLWILKYLRYKLKYFNLTSYIYQCIDLRKVMIYKSKVCCLAFSTTLFSLRFWIFIENSTSKFNVLFAFVSLIFSSSFHSGVRWGKSSSPS